jgi:RNA polymerase sigma factor (sigma-70 family)
VCPSLGSTDLVPFRSARHAVEPLPSLERILPEHLAYIRSVIARFGVTPTYWREDLVQDVLIEAHRSRASRLDVRALLFGITRHVVLRWRAKRVAEHTAVARHVEHEIPTERSIEEESQRREVVRQALDEVPGLFRDVLVRTHVEQKSMPEVTKDLGIPLNTGYTRLRLAQARFLAALHRVLARRPLEGGVLR